MLAWQRAYASRSASYNGAGAPPRRPYIVKIYTRTGDSGDTSLLGGTRVSKSDPRVDAYGEVDEANAWLGFSVACLKEPASTGQPAADCSDIADALVRIQRDLFALGAQVADPSAGVGTRVAKAALGDADIGRLEELIDRLDAELPPLRKFILAGGVRPGAALHVSRTVCRRAERRLVALDPPVDPILVRYLNRLSDLLFVMARAVNHRAAVPETEW